MYFRKADRVGWCCLQSEQKQRLHCGDGSRGIKNICEVVEIEREPNLLRKVTEMSYLCSAPVQKGSEGLLEEWVIGWLSPGWATWLS